MNPYAAQIYIDGSCYNNPGGVGGLAGILEMPDSNDQVIIFQEGYKSTTNNRMEIRALINALEYIKRSSSKLRNNGINQIEIWSDSETAIKCYYCVEKWRTKKWTGAYGNPIRNIDLLKKFITLKNSVRFSYKICYIVSKSTEATKKVDKLAKEAANRSLLRNDEGYIKPRVSRSNVIGATEPFDARGQQMVIRVFEHSPVTRRKDSLYKVKFETMTTENGKKYYAHTSREINNLLDRWHYYKALFNDNPNNPHIEKVEEVEEVEFLAQCE